MWSQMKGSSSPDTLMIPEAIQPPATELMAPPLVVRPTPLAQSRYGSRYGRQLTQRFDRVDVATDSVWHRGIYRVSLHPLRFLQD